MTEPLRDSGRTPPSSDEADRAARIEELLVSGLDHYFAAEYEQAINIWTRVVFLERDHDRARAYIERARTAIAERQRESEELLHRGVDAYKSGDVESARELLTRAVDQGAPSDEALLLLNRLERFEGSGFDHAPAYQSSSPSRMSASVAQAPPARHPWRWLAAAAISLAFVGAVAVGGAPVLSWLTDVGPAVPQSASAPEPLPMVRTADVLLDKARVLKAGGHPHEALRLLDQVELADPARDDANQMKGEIQRDLLAGGSANAVPIASGAVR